MALPNSRWSSPLPTDQHLAVGAGKAETDLTSDISLLSELPNIPSIHGDIYFADYDSEPIIVKALRLSPSMRVVSVSPLHGYNALYSVVISLCRPASSTSTSWHCPSSTIPTSCHTLACTPLADSLVWLAHGMPTTCCPTFDGTQQSTTCPS